MPGDDMAAVGRFVIDTFGDEGLVFVPELPGRGVAAGMIGRTLALVPLPIDLQPAGWRLALGEGVDQRRARSLVAQDLDRFEELADGLELVVKQQVTGPLTLAATVEKTRGDKVLSDHGARRELAAALAEGVRDHVADLRRRFPRSDLVIQVDEPGVVAVLGGGVPTASGFGRHRVVHPPEASDTLHGLVTAIEESGGRAVVHSCAADVPVALLAGAGFSAISFDLTLAEPDDVWAEAFEAGTDLWFGGSDAAEIEAFMGRLGFDVQSFAERTVATPACGLAGSSPGAARTELQRVVKVAASFG